MLNEFVGWLAAIAGVGLAGVALARAMPVAFVSGILLATLGLMSATALALTVTLSYTTPSADTAGAPLPAQVNKGGVLLPYFEQCRVQHAPTSQGPWTPAGVQNVILGVSPGTRLTHPLDVPDTSTCYTVSCVDQLFRPSPPSNVACRTAAAPPPTQLQAASPVTDLAAQ